MHLLYILLVVLLATRVCGEAAERLNQPSLVGELLAGIAMGVIFQRYGHVLPILSALPDNEVYKGFTDLSIFFLMLLAGLELRPRDLAKTSGPAMAIAAGGVLLPMLFGVVLGRIFLPDSPYKLAQCLFLGTALAITAVPVSVKILMDLHLLRSKLGQAIVSAALFDDIFSLILLAVLTAIINTGQMPEASVLLVLLLKAVLFFVVTIAMGLYLLPWINRTVVRFKSDESEFSTLLVVALLFALLAEALGLHFILGAFVAGLFFVRRTMSDAVYTNIKGSLTSWTKGFFAPLFFASIGLHLNLSALTEIPLFVFLLVMAAVIGKLLGAGLPAVAMGFSPRQSFGIGAAMSARGAVELIVAEIAMEAGLFSRPFPVPPEVANLFSAVVIMALVTTVLTSLVVRPILGLEKSGRQRE